MAVLRRRGDPAHHLPLRPRERARRKHDPRVEASKSHPDSRMGADEAVHRGIEAEVVRVVGGHRAQCFTAGQFYPCICARYFSRHLMGHRNAPPAAPNHSHRIISIPYRRGIDVYCFGGLAYTDGCRTRRRLARAPLAGATFSTTLVCSICAGPTSEGRSPRRIRMAGSRKHVLEGFKALDFTQFVAGPTVTKLMAETGAEIIKVEFAPDGDRARGIPYIKNNRSGYYVQQNRGKLILCLDTRKESVSTVVSP